MFHVLSLDPATCQRLTWTLVHFIWQGLALAVVLAIVLAAMRLRGAGPRYRYLACCACLVCMALAPLMTFVSLDRSVYDPGPLVLPAAVGGHAQHSHGAQPAWAQMSLWLRDHVQRNSGPLVGTWSIAVCVLGLFQLLRLAVLQQSVRATSTALPAQWDGLRLIPAKVGVRYAVSIVVSPLVDAPATLGWFKPIVLIPASILTGLPREVVEALVAHELAHVRRWDYLVNLLQTSLETLLWWHPAVWWVSGKVRDEREHCCDELAAGISGGRVKYAKALTALEDLRIRTPQFAMGSQGGSLVARVARLVGGPISVRSRRKQGGVAAVFSAIALAVLLAAQVSSSAISNPPSRSIEQVRSLCGAVYDILAIPQPTNGSDGVWLERLDQVLSADGEAERDAAVEQLVDAMNRSSTPDRLASDVLSRVHLGAKGGYESSPDWTHGTYGQRTRLTHELWLEAKRLLEQDGTDRAAAYGRAAILLAAQDIFLFGPPTLEGLSKDNQFELLTALDDRQAIQLRRHLEDHKALADAFYQHLNHADAALGELPSTTDPAAELHVVDEIEAMLTIIPGRPDLQWLAASTAARLFAARPNPVGTSASMWAQRWSARLPNDPHFARWMSEAVANPSVVKAPKRISSDSLRKVH